MLRSAPDHEAPAIGMLTNGLQCSADTLTGSWLHVTTPSGQQGYVAAAFVEGGVDGVMDTLKSATSAAVSKVKSFFTGGSTSGKSTTTKYVTGDNVRLRSSTDTTSTKNVISTLKKGATVTCNPGRSNSSWGYVTTVDGKSGYMSAVYLADSTPGTPKTTSKTTTDTTPRTATDTTKNNAVPAVIPSNPNNSSNNSSMTLTENTRKYIKWGAIALLAGGVGYGIYKAVKNGNSGNSGSAPAKAKKAKGLSGVSRRRRKKRVKCLGLC